MEKRETIMEALKSMENIIKDIKTAVQEDDLNGLEVHLKTFATEISKISPVVAPVIEELLQEYGSSMKPIFDELIKAIAKAKGYGYEKATEIIEKTSVQAELHNKVLAEHYFKKVEILMNAGFDREEAMSILLLEILSQKQSECQSLKGISQIIRARPEN
ncbi:hypothetical protein KAS79_03285 [Candidatus Parcubacteria bacterium]|nr:hypothetical protein [Candidatus Parcubacteria bacterium]